MGIGELIKKFKGKRAKILVAFSDKHGAIMPTSYEGVIENIGGFTEGLIFIIVGNHLINANYIIDIELLD